MYNGGGAINTESKQNKGTGIFYRYHPRELESLCKDRLKDKINVHESTLKRIESRTANYAPGHLPYEFNVVPDDKTANTVSIRAGGDREKWENEQYMVVGQASMTQEHCPIMT